MNPETEAHAKELGWLATRLDMNADWVLIKWPPDDREHGDIDIMVADDDLGAVESLLAGHGYHYDDDPDPYRRKWVWGELEIDIHTEAAWVSIQYLDKEWILETAIEAERAGITVPVPSTEADLCIWAAHDMRSNAITHADARYCRDLVTRADGAECLRRAAEYGWQHQFRRFIKLIHRPYFGPAGRKRTYPHVDPPVLSAWLQARKALNRIRNGDVRAGLAELEAIVTFDAKEFFLR